MTWVQTKGGRAVDLLAPTPESIDLEDIAFALSHQNRFNGHVGRYSVAMHSVIVEAFMPPGTPVELRQQALLHDAAEAYIGDVVSPLKALLGNTWKTIEQRIEGAIALRFGIPLRFETFDDEDLESVDKRVLAAEAAVFFPEAQRPRSWGDLMPVDDRITKAVWGACYVQKPSDDAQVFLTRAKDLGLC
jgi:hypothetical protein